MDILSDISGSLKLFTDSSPKRLLRLIEFSQLPNNSSATSIVLSASTSPIITKYALLGLKYVE